MNKRMKKLITFLSIIVTFALLLTFVGPYVVLKSARQPEVETGYAYSEYFHTSYEDIRAGLKERVATLKNSGIDVEVSEYAVDASDDLYIDNIYLPATEKDTNLIVLTTAVHGMEGFIGSVMLDVFFDDIYPTLDTTKTGILVVANVNPYGMKYMRRYNENNVDLNRNFIIDWDEHDMASNKDYPEVLSFLQPEGKLGNALWNEVGFYLSLAKEALTKGADKISDALLTGQYEYPEGVYYGGNGDEISTAYLKSVFKDCLNSDYENIVHIDLHSGYGPRYSMVIFNSVYETMTEAETIEAFGYNNIIAYDSESFYATTGDTTDYFYRLRNAMNSDKELFSTCFEFGTIGDAFFDTILSLKYTVEENRNHWFPTKNKVTAEVVKEHYYELYYPTETAWREKTVEDFKAATEGVLKTKLK